MAMGLRGPKPETNLTVILPRDQERPKPFTNMAETAKVVWRRIVGDLPADFFKAHELDQLRAYCEAAAHNARAAAELRKKKGGGAVVLVDTKYGQKLMRNPWFDIHKETASTMASLGTKLRINKNSSLTNKAAAKIESGIPESKRAGLKFGGRE
jgi:phage terminase small subunit